MSRDVPGAVLILWRGAAPRVRPILGGRFPCPASLIPRRCRCRTLWKWLPWRRIERPSAEPDSCAADNKRFHRAAGCVAGSAPEFLEGSANPRHFNQIDANAEDHSGKSSLTTKERIDRIESMNCTCQRCHPSVCSRPFVNGSLCALCDLCGSSTSVLRIMPLKTKLNVGRLRFEASGRERRGSETRRSYPE